MQRRWNSCVTTILWTAQWYAKLLSGQNRAIDGLPWQTCSLELYNGLKLKPVSSNFVNKKMFLLAMESWKTAIQNKNHKHTRNHTWASSDYRLCTSITLDDCTSFPNIFRSSCWWNSRRRGSDDYSFFSYLSFFLLSTSFRGCHMSPIVQSIDSQTKTVICEADRLWNSISAFVWCND